MSQDTLRALHDDLSGQINEVRAEMATLNKTVEDMATNMRKMGETMDRIEAWIGTPESRHDERMTNVLTGGAMVIGAFAQHAQSTGMGCFGCRCSHQRRRKHRSRGEEEDN